MTGFELAGAALKLIGVPAPWPPQLINDACGELNRMLAYWIKDGHLSGIQTIGDFRQPVPFPAGLVRAIVYNLAVALEPQFKFIEDEGLHVAASKALDCAIKAEESGEIDCTPGEFAAPYQTSALDRELLALLHEARCELSNRLESRQAGECPIGANWPKTRESQDETALPG